MINEPWESDKPVTRKLIQEYGAGVLIELMGYGLVLNREECIEIYEFLGKWIGKTSRDPNTLDKE